ncbi:MAG: DUF1080 domain-containing protein, partial [Isosphaeraceae bacterium]
DVSRRFQEPSEVAEALVPFFKKTAAAAAQPSAPRVAPLRRPGSPPPVARPEASIAPSPPAPTPTRPIYESLVDLGDDALAPKLSATGQGRRRKPRLWPAVGAGALFIGMLLWQVAVRVQTPEGVIVIENLPKDAQVFVEGQQIKISQGDDPAKAVEIRAVPGHHKLEIMREGVAIVSREVEFKTTDPKSTVRVSLEPANVKGEVRSKITSGKEDDGVAQISDGFVPLFNGKDLSGWVFPVGGESHWTVKDGLLNGTADNNSTTIASARSDYKDFHLRVTMRTKDTKNKWFMFRAKNSQEDEYFYRFDLGGTMWDGQIMPLGSHRVKLGGKPGASSIPSEMNGLETIVNPGSTLFEKDVWHLVEIIAKDNTFRFLVDGKEVSAFRDPMSRLASGAISFRHSSTVEFRSIQVKTLGKSEPLSNAAASSERGSPSEAAPDFEGFVLLFNGKNLDGWMFPFGDASNWKTHDGTIIGSGTQSNCSIATSKANYADFHLKFDIMTFSDDNHRILFRSSADRTNDKNYMFTTGGRIFDGQLFKPGEMRIRTHGDYLDPAPYTTDGLSPLTPATKTAMTKDTWHAIEIIAKGNQFRMIVDGVEISAFKDTQSRLAKGRIEFRIGTKKVGLRKIRIREFDGEAQATIKLEQVVSTARPLFNGKDTAGWKVAPGTRRVNVVDGVLELDSGGLITDRADYSDFRLSARVYNDGMGKTLWVRRTEDAATYNAYGIRVGGVIDGFGKQVPLGSINKAIGRPLNGPITWNVEAAPVNVPFNDWYDIELTAIGNKITSYVNGNKVAEFTDGTNSHPSGHIVLSTRSDVTARYKEITIQEIPPK